MTLHTRPHYDDFMTWDELIKYLPLPFTKTHNKMADDNITTVRAKFTCDSVVDARHGDQKVVHFSATYSDNPEDNSYSEATPFGSLTMHVSNSVPASNYFEQGQAYYLDFSIVPAQ